VKAPAHSMESLWPEALSSGFVEGAFCMPTFILAQVGRCRLHSLLQTTKPRLGHASGTEEKVNSRECRCSRKT
jgi:hypothetical protein